MKQLVSRHFNSLAAIGVRCGSVLLGFAITYVIGHNLGPLASGQYALVTQSAIFLSILAVGGLDLAIVKEFSVAIAQKVLISRDSFFRVLLFTCALASVVMAVVLLGGDALMAMLAGDDAPGSAVYILLTILLARALTRVTGAFLRSQQLFILGQSVEMILIPAISLAGIVIGIAQDVDQILVLTAAAGLFAAAIGVVSGWSRTSAGKGGQAVSLRSMFKTSLPLWGVAIIANLSEWYGLVIVAHMLSVPDAGVYRVAIQIAGAMAIIAMGLLNVFSAQLSAAYAGRNFQQIAKLSRTATRLSFAVVLPPTIAIGALAAHILGLIGPEFETGASVLRIVLVGQAVFVIFGPVGLVLALTGHARMNFLINLASIVSLLALAPLGIYFAGVNGIAIAVSFLLVMRSVLSFIIVRNTIGINVFTGSYDERKVAGS